MILWLSFLGIRAHSLTSKNPSKQLFLMFALWTMAHRFGWRGLEENYQWNRARKKRERVSLVLNSIEGHDLAAVLMCLALTLSFTVTVGLCARSTDQLDALEGRCARQQTFLHLPVAKMQKGLIRNTDVCVHFFCNHCTRPTWCPLYSWEILFAKGVFSFMAAPFDEVSSDKVYLLRDVYFFHSFLFYCIASGGRSEGATRLGHRKIYEDNGGAAEPRFWDWRGEMENSSSIPSRWKSRVPAHVCDAALGGFYYYWHHFSLGFYPSLMHFWRAFIDFTHFPHVPFFFSSAITMANRDAFPGGFRLPARVKLRLFNKEQKHSYSGGNKRYSFLFLYLSSHT